MASNKYLCGLNDLSIYHHQSTMYCIFVSIFFTEHSLDVKLNVKHTRTSYDVWLDRDINNYTRPNNNQL